MIKVIDLFAGCGGFSSGFIKAGFQITKAVEFNEEIASTYKANHICTRLIVDDIRVIDNDDNFKNGEADVIIGGPPCQGFSMAGARIREGFVSDKRNFLFRHYFNIVKIVKPKVFIMENVKGILTMEKGQIFKEIVDVFSNGDNFNGDKYFLQHKIIKASEFGLPQARERVLIIGTLNKQIDIDWLINLIKNNIEKNDSTFFKKTTVWDAISNLGQPSSNGVVENPEAKTQYQNALSCKNNIVTNHVATKHNAVAVARMKKIKSDENWTILNENIKSIHSGSYGRLNKNGIAPTVTTRFDTPSGGKFIHPIEDRTLTPREAARIQSFNDGFVFKGGKSSICTQIGNAVPPKLAYFFAELVKEVLKDDNE